MTEEVGGIGADPAYMEELTIGETLASVERVARLKSEVVMGICGFGVKVNPQCPIRFKVNHGVEEGEMGGGDFEGELDGGMAGFFSRRAMRPCCHIRKMSSMNRYHRRARRWYV